tara:strand:- start:4785 stop:5402 length:618 start_codon:yes stop_codon:yes gene_type:complete
MSRTIDYYFSVISPWSYMGHQRFMTLVEKHDLAVDFKPMHLPTLFPQTGGLPLAKRPPIRQAYRIHEMKRWREFLDIELNLEPKHFPVAEIPASCLLNYAEDRFADVGALMLAIFRAVWVEDRDITDADTLRAIMTENGCDPDWVDAAAEDQEANDRIQRDTAEAFAAGVVGAPGYVFKGEPFWRQDRLDILDWRLTQDAAAHAA